jgi:hypothetical protein
MQHHPTSTRSASGPAIGGYTGRVLGAILLCAVLCSSPSQLWAQGTGTAPAAGVSYHSISVSEASRLTGNYRNAPGSSIHAEYFSTYAVLGLLGQENCIGLRIYYGRQDDGTPALIMVAVDSSGRDRAGENSLLLERGFLCPPICDNESPLLK